MLNGVSVFLVGMMGSGKSTVGRLLAERLGYGFADVDQLIEKISGMSVSALFAERGEAAFRALESQVLAELATYTRLVVATGGGAVLERRNWGYLRHGAVVWLDADVETLAERVQQQPLTRPLLAGVAAQQRLAEILEGRSALYAEADVRVDATGAPEAVVTSVLVALAERIAADRAEADGDATS